MGSLKLLFSSKFNQINVNLFHSKLLPEILEFVNINLHNYDRKSLKKKLNKE